MNEKNYIEVCVGVGTNQFFPEIVKVIIDDYLEEEKEEKLDHEKYYYYGY
jgi:hypothetical protein